MYVLGKWGSGEYAEVHNTQGGKTWSPRVWLPDRRVDGPATESLQMAQLWAEYVIDKGKIPSKPDLGIVYEKKSDRTAYTITGLADASEYAVRVKASNQSGDSAWTAPQWMATASVPDAPAAPVVTPGEKQLEVSWIAPDDGGSKIIHYELRLSWGSGDPTKSLTLITTPTTTPFTETITLSGGSPTEYAVEIRAKNAVGNSAWSDPSYPAPVSPGVPGDVAAWPDDREIHIDWKAPEYNGAVIRGYTVSISSPDNSYVMEAPLGAKSYSTGSNPDLEILNGVTYAVKVRAIAMEGKSHLYGPWSDEVLVTPGPAPLAPTLYSPVPGDGQVAVSWAPTPYSDPSDNGNEITGYTLQWRSEQQDYDTQRQAVTSDTLYTITGLTNMTEYDVRVKATNAAGDSDWSERSARTAWPPAAPAQPHVTHGSEIGELVVSWSEPPDNGAAITSYTVRWERAVPLDGTPSDSWTVVRKGDLSAYLYVGGDGPIKSYAELHNAEGKEKDVVSATAWIPHVWLYASDRKVVGRAFDNLQEVQLWAEYVIDHPEFDYTVHEATTGDTTTYTLTGLPFHDPYDVRVKATNAAGDSDWSPELPPQGAAPHPPGAPTAVLDPGGGQIQVSWSEPPDNGAAITGYTVQWQVALDGTPSSVWKVVSDPVWGDMYRHYDPDRPWPQAAVVEEPWNGGWVAVVWLSEDDKRSGPNTSLEEAMLWAEYVMAHPDFPDPDVVHEATTSASDTTYTISGLSRATTYYVEVKATNAAGDSEWSSTVRAETADVPGAPHIGENYFEGSGVLVVFSVLRNAIEIYICFTDPASDGGSDITSYVIQWRRKDAGNWDKPQQVSVPNTGPILMKPPWPEELYWAYGECYEGELGLGISADGYVARASAVNAAGQGPWSNTRQAIVGSEL